jgi:hypothetical protein
MLYFMDDQDVQWKFSFIYYNGRLFGGTRNEYRLTRMTPFIRESGLRAGDELILARSDARRTIAFRRQKGPSVDGGVLKLGTAWKVVSL